MSSVRQQIVDAIAARLVQIAPGKVWSLPDGPYTCTSAPKSVTPWRRVPYSPAQVPAIAFWDADSAHGEPPLAHHEHRLGITIVGFVAGNAAIDTVRALLADMVAAVGSDPRWGGLADWTEIDSQDIDVEQAGDVIAGCQISITVVYRTRLWRM